MAVVWLFDEDILT